MRKIPFESYKKQLIVEIQQTTDYDSLEDRLLDAQMEMENGVEVETDEELLVKILKVSHQQVVAGKTYSQQEVEHLIDQRLYELRNKMDGACVAEPC